jgi:hypothetical protein
MIVAKVLVDNGSALNICPLITFTKLGIDHAIIRPSSIVIRAFDGSRREVMGEADNRNPLK